MSVKFSFNINRNSVIFLSLIVFCNYYVNCDTLKLYDNLVHCYRNESLNPLVPNSLQILLELIRKVEDGKNTSIDIRFLSSKLIHQLRIDGIRKGEDAIQTEYITPYQANGIMTPKLSLLLKLISDVPGTINFEEYLTPLEICTLHRLISSTIEPKIRGDEHKTCKLNGYDEIPTNKVVIFENSDAPYIISHKTSKCPVESGVIRTYNFGSFSPGIVIASIAAGLQPQLVQINELYPSLQRSVNRFENLETMERRDTSQKIRKLIHSINDVIDNTYSANLAGDLAEVCVYQTPYYRKNVTVGTFGQWNNLEYPIIRYVNESNTLNWAMTDSEILAGIDGFYLAKNINNWVNKISRMRLSQILEMFYSPKGIPNFLIESSNRKKKPMSTNQRYMMPLVQEFNPSSFDQTHSNIQPSTSDISYYDSDRYRDSACERRNILNRIPREKLKYESFLFAKILQLSTDTPMVEDNLLKVSCNAAVDRFFERAHTLLTTLPKCKSGSKPAIDLTIVLDGSRNKTESLKLISYITEKIDVSSYSSKFAVIHGSSGKYMANSTHSIVTGFEQIREFGEDFPESLSLTESFATIINSLENSAPEKKNLIAGISPVILVISQSEKIRQNDFENAKRIIDGPFQSNHDAYFVFITNDGKSFQDLISDAEKHESNSKDKFTIIEKEDLDPKKLTTELIRAVRYIPKWLQPIACENNHQSYEDYVGKDHANYYRISFHQLIRHKEIAVQFQTVESYGVITVCKTVDLSNSECLSTQNVVNDEIWFNITNPCSSETNCPAINFRVELDNSNAKCSETNCRYPDQIRFNIRLQTNKCSRAIGFLKSCSQTVILCVMLLKFLLG